MLHTPFDMLSTVASYPEIVPLLEDLLEIRQQRRAEKSFYVGIPDKTVPWGGVITD
jgi:hypothetical protein